MTGTTDVLICTEASPEIGHGHVVRSHSLAAAARDRQLGVTFFAPDGYTASILAALGERVLRCFPDEAPPFVVRDFRSGTSPETVSRDLARGSRVLLMDETGTARTLASVVCDSLMTSRRRSGCLHGTETLYLYGLAFAPLRPQFASMKGRARPGLSGRPRLFVCFGGNDPSLTTLKFIESLDRWGFAGPATVIVSAGDQALALEGIMRKWEASHVRSDVGNVASLMAQADLVATKVGVLMLESFCVGLGCVLVEPSPAHVFLQEQLLEEYVDWPAIELGLAEGADFDGIARKTLELLGDGERLSTLGDRAARLVDGMGAGRIVDALVGTDGAAAGQSTGTRYQ